MRSPLPTVLVLLLATVNSLRGLVRKQPGAPRWPYVASGSVALLFLGHAFEDAGWIGAAPYVAIIGVSVVSAMWVTVAGWALLFVLFLAYGLIVAMLPDSAPFEEWILFVAMGFGPALLLWAGRPALDGRPPRTR